METLLIQNATIINEGESFVGGVLVVGDRIAKVYRGEIPASSPLQVCKVIDATGLLCMPGVIDDQVHFREPGLTHKGDIASESRAAICGGVTSYMEMPNTLPQTTTLQAWQEKMERAAQTSYANYAFYMGATNDNADVLQQMDLQHTPGVKVFMGSSTGNMLVDNEATLQRIFSESPILIAIHSESEEVIKRNKAKVVSVYGDDPAVTLHPVIRDSEACYTSTQKAIRLAKQTGARLHILHISTAQELTLLQKDIPLQQKRITAEVCVHHLWFEETAYSSLGARVKWNPAVKSQLDREALREAVRTGVVDVVATDHAPHLLEEKQGGALRAASGGPLVEHSLLMMLELARQGEWSYELVVDFMCHRPATLFGIEQRGFIREGYYADLVLVTPNSSWIVTDNNTHYKCGWTPLAGTTLHHAVQSTIVNGQVVYHQGEISPVRAAKPLTFQH